MQSTKQNLLVTLADRNYINQAKQLFSSVYKNSGWQGDYMLLTDSLDGEMISEFKSKGIIVYSPPIIDNIRFSPDKKYPPLLLSKLYLFTTYFKKWEKIIFIDADVIVNTSLDTLLQKTSFNAPNAETFTLKNEFKDDKKAIKELELNKDYNLKTNAFNSGIFCFETDLIKDETFPDLLAIYKKYKNLCIYGEESVLNLYFYKKWNQLSDLYNYNPYHFSTRYKTNTDKVAPIVTHFYYKYKPWHKDNNYYTVWQENLSGFESIDLKYRPSAKAIDKHKLDASEKYLNQKIRLYKFKRIFTFLPLIIDRQIGRLGLYLKRLNPSLYSRISLKKDD